MINIEYIQIFFTDNYKFFLWFAIVFLAFYLFRTIIIIKLVSISKKTTNTIDDAVVAVLRTISLPFAIAISTLAGLWVMDVSIMDSMLFLIICVLIITFQLSRAVSVLLDHSVEKLSGNGNVAAFQGLRTIIRILIWIGGIVFLIGAMGYNITSMVAGLGIGGIAIALAAQSMLSDIFSSFSIYFDKPFKVDDYIINGAHEGTVERIGLKTTRIRSPRGEEIVISNQTLTSAVVQNLGEMERRRAVDLIELAYDTPNAKLEKLQNDIKLIVNKIELADFDRLFFKDFGQSALEWELVYYINSSDYAEYLTAKHEINMALKQYFEKQNIELAYPTQTVHVKK